MPGDKKKNRQIERRRTTLGRCKASPSDHLALGLLCRPLGCKAEASSRSTNCVHIGGLGIPPSLSAWPVDAPDFFLAG